MWIMENDLAPKKVVNLAKMVKCEIHSEVHFNFKNSNYLFDLPKKSLIFVKV